CHRNLARLDWRVPRRPWPTGEIHQPPTTRGGRLAPWTSRRLPGRSRGARAPRTGGADRRSGGPLPRPARGARALTGRPARGRRLAGRGLRVLIPLVITGLAAGLGYAFAVYPIWYHVDQVRKTETLRGLITIVDARKQFLGAYFDDSGVDPKAFDEIAWAVKTVMTPFVGYAPAPGQQHNAYLTPFQFRTRGEPAMPKPPGVTRIFLTGASVAFSAGAPDDQRTIGGYLPSLLDRRDTGSGHRYEVFTFAAPAWSSTHERIAIENRLSDLQPDLVVELTGIGDALYGERGHNVLWARAVTDQYYWDLVNIALRRAGFAPM